MTMITKLSSEQAMHNALVYGGIENEDFECLFKQYEDGLYHFLVHTTWMQYEFYVEAGTGEVLGIQTEPLVYWEDLCPCEGAKEALSAVA